MFNTKLLEAVERFTKEDLAGKARTFDDEQRFPDAFWEFLVKDLKLFTCLLSEEDQPLSFRTFLETLRLISKEYASLASLLLTQGIYTIWAIERFADPDQRKVYLPDLVSGLQIGAFAFSEPDIHLKRDMPQTLARQTEEGWVLKGHKHMVSNASLADLCLVYAQTISLDNSLGTGIFLVETAKKGVSVGPTISKSGMKSLPIAPISFEDVSLADNSLLGARLDARNCLAEILVKMRLAISAQSLGIAEGVFKKGLDYSKLKRGFGRRPIDVSVNQLKFSEIEMKLAACEAYYHACIGGEMSDDRQISMLKLLTTETAQEVAEDVVRITGAYSFIADNDIERYVNDAKITGLYGGSTDSLKHNIARIWLDD